MIKIILNNKEFNIDDAIIASIANDLKHHLSTTMAGTGATIELDGVAYNIDSTKLTSATNDFISHLGTVAGNGSKVTVGGVEYGVDSNKVAGAVTGLEGTFGELNGGGSVWPLKYDLSTHPEGVEWAKISDYVPTKEEIDNLFVYMTNTNYAFILQGYEDETDNGFFADYRHKIDWNSYVGFGVMSILSVTPEFLEAGFTEPGLYIWNDIGTADAVLVFDMPISSPNPTDINEYGFLYDYEYYCIINDLASALVFREDGSIDMYQSGVVATTIPAGSAVYSNGTIDLSTGGMGVGAVSSDGAVIDFEVGLHLVILATSEKRPK